MCSRLFRDDLSAPLFRAFLMPSNNLLLCSSPRKLLQAIMLVTDPPMAAGVPVGSTPQLPVSERSDDNGSYKEQTTGFSA